MSDIPKTEAAPVIPRVTQPSDDERRWLRERLRTTSAGAISRESGISRDVIQAIAAGGRLRRGSCVAWKLYVLSALAAAEEKP